MRFRPHLNFTITILTAFSLVFTAAVVLVVLGFREVGSRAAVDAAERHLGAAAAAAAAGTRGLIQPLLGEASVLARIPDAADASLEPALGALLAEASLVAVTFVDGDGGLRQVLRHAALAHGRGPPPAPAGAGLTGARAPPRRGGALRRWSTPHRRPPGNNAPILRAPGKRGRKC